MSTYRFVAGQTAPIDFTLKDGAAAADITGYASISLLLTNIDTGAAVTTTGDVTVTSAATGAVRYSPDSADLVAGRYHARFKVVDGGGLIFYWPGQDQPDVWLIGPETL